MDECGNIISQEEVIAGVRECIGFINDLRDWRAGRFTISLTEWANMPAVVKDLIEMYDRISAEMKKK